MSINGGVKSLVQGDLSDAIAILVGTRPGIIKMAPLIHHLRSQSRPFLLIHTGQHYSENMDLTFFSDLQLPTPHYHHKETRTKTLHGAQTAEMLVFVEEVLIKERPKLLMVCGDANFNLAGALAARKLGIGVAHVESGLRSKDWRMPEEHNRIMIDHISDLLFAPTHECRRNLLKENIQKPIEVFGNTIVDSVEYVKRLSAGTKQKGQVLLTLHREENVDVDEKLLALHGLIEAVLASPHVARIKFPVHPRTVKRFGQLGLLDSIRAIPNLEVLDPMGYVDFIGSIKNSEFVLTDSGGIQEEACILGTHCLTMRDNTERPESIEVGANRLVGFDERLILESIETCASSDPSWSSPFGQPGVAALMIEAIDKHH